MNPVVVVIILVAIALCFVPRNMKQPKRKAKKFGEGMFQDTHGTDWSGYGNGDYRP